jgi:hypothetical protein
MIARIIFALAVCVAATQAFDLRDQPLPYSIVDANSSIECFSKTAFKVHFSYGKSFTSQTGDQTTTAYPSISCGSTNGRTLVYGDMVWAIARDSSTACLQFTDMNGLPMVAGNLDSFKPNATLTTFNQNYKYLVTRQLGACAFDSNYKVIHTPNTKTADELKEFQNANAQVKVSYQFDSYKIYVSKWDEELKSGSNGQDWESVSAYCAGNCDVNTMWKNPSNNIATGTFNSSRSDDEKFYFGTAGANAGNCQQTSTWTCAPGTLDTQNCGYKTTEDGDTGYNALLDTSSTNSAPNTITTEKIACGSSAELLARSADYSETAIPDDKTAGSTKDAQNVITAPVLSSIGIHQDILGSNGLWVKLMRFNPTITHFQGNAVSGAEYQANKVFQLNNQELVDFTFMQSNTDYKTMGYATALNMNKVYVLNNLGALGNTNAVSLTPVAFDRSSQTANYANGQVFTKGSISQTNGLGNSQIGNVGEHFWAFVKSTYAFQWKWTCKNRGTSNQGTVFPYRFNCDWTASEWTSTSGKAYNNGQHQYPNLMRQFTASKFNQYADETISATSDPVFLGTLNSVTNQGFALATAQEGINGKRVDSPTESIATASNDQADAIKLIGAGVVTLAVLGSVAIIVGGFLIGKK